MAATGWLGCLGDEHGPGKAVFVPFVIEGERIEASLLEQKRGFARGRAEAILQASSTDG